MHSELTEFYLAVAYSFAPNNLPYFSSDPLMEDSIFCLVVYSDDRKLESTCFSELIFCTDYYKLSMAIELN